MPAAFHSDQLVCGGVETANVPTNSVMFAPFTGGVWIYSSPDAVASHSNH